MDQSSGLLLIQVPVLTTQDPSRSLQLSIPLCIYLTPSTPTPSTPTPSTSTPSTRTPPTPPIANITHSATFIQQSNKTIVYSVLERISLFISSSDAQKLSESGQLTDSKLHKASFYVCQNEKWHKVGLNRILKDPILETFYYRIRSNGGAEPTSPDFAILELTSDLSVTNSIPVDTDMCGIGTEITVISSPFGLLGVDLYLNSVTKGVISAVLEQSIVLLDVRSLPGTSGGSVFYQSQPIGLIIPSFTAISPFAVMYPLRGISDSGVICQQYDSIVSIKSGCAAGSGVVWAPGLILTNKHVVGTSTTVEIRCKDDTYTGKVVVCGEVLDAALIAIPQWRGGRPVRRTRLGRVGDRVLAVGFGAVVERPTRLPVVTSGILCKRVGRDGSTIAIQTSAHILDGQSGGGLFTPEGVFLGLITSTVKLSGLPIRSLSLSIALEALETQALWTTTDRWLKDVFDYQTVDTLPEYKGKL